MIEHRLSRQAPDSPPRDLWRMQVHRYHNSVRMLRRTMKRRIEMQLLPSGLTLVLILMVLVANTAVVHQRCLSAWATNYETGRRDPSIALSLSRMEPDSGNADVQIVIDSQGQPLSDPAFFIDNNSCRSSSRLGMGRRSCMYVLATGGP